MAQAPCAGARGAAPPAAPQQPGSRFSAKGRAWAEVGGQEELPCCGHEPGGRVEVRPQLSGETPVLGYDQPRVLL